MPIGKANISAGLFFLAGFMAFGFYLIYVRHGGYPIGEHFEARLAHVHGALFGFLNIVLGYLLMQLRVPAAMARVVSWLALAGMLMPLTILAEAALGWAPMALVLIGAAAMTAAVALLGVAVARLRT
jgi:hypothetical protein